MAVETVVGLLAGATSSAAAGEILSGVSTGKYNRPFNFWPSVYDDKGRYVACGREENVVGGRSTVAGKTLTGQDLEKVLHAETGIEQDGVWPRLVLAATSGDGYYVHLSSDRYPAHAKKFHKAARDAVARVGFARAVTVAGLGTLYVSSSFSDMPNSEAAIGQPCDWKYDGLCSLAYTRRVLGAVTTAMLRVDSAAELQEVFARTTWREFNEQAGASGSGFYPFIYTIAGKSVAHGANPSLLGRTLPDIISGSATLRELVDGKKLNDRFVEAALQGGGWAGYYWRNGINETPYLKIAFISGVKRFGTTYYIGVGYNHQMPPPALGPHCTACKQNYNYPCAWANAAALVAHVQSMMFMANRYKLKESFDLLTQDTTYGGGGKGAPGRDIMATKNWLYAFMYDYNSTCVAHGANAAFVGRKLSDIIHGSPRLRVLMNATKLHEEFVAAAKSGGRWVGYTWKNSDREPIYLKLAYIVPVTRDGRSYFLGVGLGDNDWRDHVAEIKELGGGDAGGPSQWWKGCSADHKHPCVEDWANALAGRRMASILTSTSHSVLQARLQKQPAVAGMVPLGASPPEPESPFGFKTHIHNSTHVIVDGHDPQAFNGKPLHVWLTAVGLSADKLVGHNPAGTWLGPFQMKLETKASSAARPTYLFQVSVAIEDALADGAADGASDTYTIIVAVGAGKPMSSLLDTNVDGKKFCYQRPANAVAAAAAALQKGESGGSSRSSSPIKCVTDLEEFGHDAKTCAGANSYGICPAAATNEWQSLSATAPATAGRVAWPNGDRQQHGCIALSPPASAPDQAKVAAVPGVAAQFCTCKPGYRTRFARPQTLFDGVDAVCSASISSPCGEGDTSCAIRQDLQLTYEQFCALDVNTVPLELVISLVSVIGALIAFFVIQHAARSYIARNRLVRQAKQNTRQRVLDALETTNYIQFPYVVVPSEDFLKLNALITHEEARDSGLLTFHDSIEEVQKSGTIIIFISHQWTSFTAPDPSGRQFEVMKAAVAAVIERNKLPPQRVSVWVDYMSIPQVARTQQENAIMSLSSYASTAHLFVIVAPPIEHNELNTTLGFETYGRRMWCRAEQLFHILQNGTDKLWLATAEDADCIRHLADDESWKVESLPSAIRVFDGAATNDEDKVSLVPIVLGVYAEMLALCASADNGNNEKNNVLLQDRRAAFELISKNPADFFPPTYVPSEGGAVDAAKEKEKGKGMNGGGDGESRKKKKAAPVELFGGLVKELEKVLHENPAFKEQLTAAIFKKVAASERTIAIANPATAAECSGETGSTSPTTRVGSPGDKQRSRRKSYLIVPFEYPNPTSTRVAL